MNDLEILPRLDLFISNRNEKTKTNEFIDGQNFTRTIEIQRSLTRADHNEMVQCQVVSMLNHDVYLKKHETIDVQCKFESI